MHKLPRPTSTQTGLAAITGLTETTPSVMTTALEVAPHVAGVLAVAGSSSDSPSTYQAAASYQAAHAAATESSTETKPQDRMSALFEAQLARAIKESYRTWLSDKENRERICEELRKGVEEADVMDVEPTPAKAKGNAPPVSKSAASKSRPKGSSS